ncbi:MAG: cobalamin biosynthesis protein [Candidatus Bathyarchaeia archaeon]
MIQVSAILIVICALVMAIILDLFFGDPAPWKPWKKRYNLHPTVMLGGLTKKLEKRFRNSNPKIEKLNGVFLALIVIAAIAVPVFLVVWFIFVFLGFNLFSLLVYAVFAAVILKFTICVKLETDGCIAVVKALEVGDLVEARRYAHFSRRDPSKLTGAQIASSVIESMVENLTDFKLSPFLYYASFGVPGAVAYRAINTLDGMVGFRDPRYINIGWFSATLDTIVNYVPARLTTILMIVASAFTGDDYRNAWKIARRDHAKVPSRNHGWQMAAIAGALHVQLEKPGQYAVGDPVEELTPDKIIRALKIRNISMVLCFLLMLPIFLAVGVYMPFLWGFPILQFNPASLILG